METLRSVWRVVWSLFQPPLLLVLLGDTWFCMCHVYFSPCLWKKQDAVFCHQNMYITTTVCKTNKETKIYLFLQICYCMCLHLYFRSENYLGALWFHSIQPHFLFLSHSNTCSSTTTKSGIHLTRFFFWGGGGHPRCEGHYYTLCPLTCLTNKNISCMGSGLTNEEATAVTVSSGL